MVDTKNLESVRAYLQEHKAEIIEKYSANGVAIGKQNLTNDHYVIVVYLQDLGQLPKQPVRVNGIPLKFEVTGTFTLHSK